MAAPVTRNTNYSLYGAPSYNDMYSLDSPAKTASGRLKSITEHKVVISNAEEWNEGITYYSLHEAMNDVIHSNKSDISTPLKKKKLSPFYFVIFNILSGCGIVGLPKQYLNADGILPGVIITILVSILSIYTMRLLIYTGIKLDCRDYERLVSSCFGFTGYYIISFSILIFDIGACLCYTIILGNSIQDVMEYIFDLGIGSNRNRQLFIVFIYFFIILPLLFGKNFRFIEKIQIIGIMICLFLISVVVFKYYDEYQYIDNVDFHLFDRSEKDFKDWMDITGAFGAITFSLIQHDVTFLVFKTLKNPSYEKVSMLSLIGMVIQCILCIILCVYGYMSFGRDLKDDILRNYSTHSDRYPLIMCIRIFYVVRMSFIFPTAFYVVRHILFAIIYRGYDTYEHTTLTKKIVFTLIPFIIFLGVGLYIRHLDAVMSLFGLLSAINIAFVVPCLCYLKAGTEYSIFWWKAESGKLKDALIDTLPSIILIIIGSCLTIFGSLEYIYFHVTSNWLK